mgnify:CR=1 FL=1
MAEYDEELKTNYDNGIADGSIAEGTSFEDWKKTQAEFDENAFKTAFDEQYAKDFDETAFRAQFDKDYDELSAIRVRLMPMISSCPMRILPLMQTSTN